MSKQEKSTTEKNTKTLRELLKHPENKTCADCKRNDPRWASWNLGVFLCIRCSGVHRSMGTHISKVKSVDLDVWTPEQMQSVMKWGNARANIYWEAHLRAGHIPPDHKMDSFIRSKYESRRWAMEGPPPDDPSVLDNPPTQVEAPSGHAAPSPETIPAPSIPSSIARTRHPDAAVHGPLISPKSATTSPVSSVQQSDIFSLDFSPPMNPQPSAATKDVKNDILSLFEATASPLPAGETPASFVGQNGGGMWGLQPGWSAATAKSPIDSWGLFSNAPAAAVPTDQSDELFSAHGFASSTPQNVWAASAAPAPLVSRNALVDTNGGWHSTNSMGDNGIDGGTSGGFGDLSTMPGVTANIQAKKDDVFGNLWAGLN
ncbi:hypothetical protein BS47DRAFT_1373930 [Hydnum rufescens UP504]|uniref:Arf-GAP domain-containing protein n=1 Tax=Hydnum rufescens UP504 TaxID=1448309 RepID=A0A9P6DQF4_9AGAM|nr:hypothetical protein BS47DRAFT_1373930 [Hydnum rufescens UP504]